MKAYPVECVGSCISGCGAMLLHNFFAATSRVRASIVAADARAACFADVFLTIPV